MLRSYVTIPYPTLGILKSSEEKINELRGHSITSSFIKQFCFTPNLVAAFYFGRDTRKLYRFFPEVSARLSSDWVEPDYETSQLLTGHGCFRKRPHDMRLNDTSMCFCGQTDEDMHHVLWSCPLYDDIRSEMLSDIEVMQVGPVYYTDLVGSQANFRRLREYARAWHRLRGGQT
ncbi:Retrovirus-related Pol polyprotein from type-1 retrotransposable element R1 4 [Eumeta japonica]|uniref:Retrovirus-related Pol polyprotein from type-1 retrotransposable element R1 4 n=1 Tax=Eumeta variegata TaxID=151549 RepID=A0A4C1TFH4_EUMVA|nr:Retrovirus-related Pol polyprotein from type-1 retrotransposable element R1 4 [Eumeta japonica]